ncbi:MAG: hypothetical protein QXI33_00885 [Candidatus Pacearchaeota archaeon]
MNKLQFLKNGFTFRAVQCPKCGNRIVHPQDKADYELYNNLRNKDFRVKMRMVGNSYTISIPKEIANFINEQNRLMDDMVRLSLERMGKLSLIFDRINEDRGKNE